MEVDCRGGKYTGAVGTVVAGLVMYTGGIPLMCCPRARRRVVASNVDAVVRTAQYLLLTWSNRAVLRKEVKERDKAERESVKSISFLWESYGPHAYYYESFAAIFRLLLCGGLNAWFDAESATGIVATLIVTALALYVQARLAPMAGCRGLVALRCVAGRLRGSRVR